MAETKRPSAGKKQYAKPAILFAKKVEVISGICTSTYGGSGVCRLSRPQCLKTRT